MVDDSPQDLIHDVLPLVETNYRIGTSPDRRAVVGLSMGGGQSLSIGLAHPDTFHWIGAFSAAPPRGDLDRRFAKTVKPSASYNEKVKLFWIACGKDDFLLERNNEFRNWLTSAGIRHRYQVTEGSHNWRVWRRYLAELLPLMFKDKDHD